MTVQEMATLAIELAGDDLAELERFGAVEDAAFEAYLADYAQSPYRICKGCHGG